ncbi:Uncharacterised protein [Bacillus freudenreichii]|nr:Uncharacterised protein [Bacillus freudenreichii]
MLISCQISVYKENRKIFKNLLTKVVKTITIFNDNAYHSEYYCRKGGDADFDISALIFQG